MTNRDTELQIKQYLQELRTELEGQELALIQDALFDSEEHIRAAIEDNPVSSFEQIIDDWGNAKEVTKQYLELESATEIALYGYSSSQQDKPPHLWVLSALTDTSSYRALLYALLTLPLSLFYCFWLVSGISSAIASLVVVGLPFLLIFICSLPHISLFEGRLIEFFLRERMPRRLSKLSISQAAQQNNFIQRLKSQLLDVTNFRTILYLFFFVPLSVLYLGSVLVPVVFSLALIASPVVDPILNALNPQYGIDINWYWLPLTLPAGLCLLSLSLHWTQWVMKGHVNLARGLLLSVKGQH